MEEDFLPVGMGGERIECYIWKVGDGMEKCVMKVDCPNGYPGV
jgi:hypothetical protein